MPTWELQLAYMIFPPNARLQSLQLVCRRIQTSNRSIVLALVLPWYVVVPRLGNITNINPCFSSNQADIFVSLLNGHLARIIAINGRYTVTHERIQEIWMSGIMTPAVLFYHIQFPTQKIFCAWFFCHSVQTCLIPWNDRRSTSCLREATKIPS
jgi:hypothetical protein